MFAETLTETHLRTLGFCDDIVSRILGHVVVAIQERWRSIGRRRAFEFSPRYRSRFTFEDQAFVLYVWRTARNEWNIEEIRRYKKVHRRYTEGNWCAQSESLEIADSERWGDVRDAGTGYPSLLEIGWHAYRGVPRDCDPFEGTEHTKNEAIEAVRMFVYAHNVARYGTVYN